MIPGQSQQFFEAAAAQSGGAASYQVERSLRFNSADSAYLNRTPSSAGNSKTFTWSGWVKQVVASGVAQTHILAAGSSPFFQFYFAGPNLYVETNLGYIQPSRVFRDPSAWYHFVVAVDTTQATATNRIRFYVNGEEVTDFAIDQRSSITQNTDLSINSAVEHRIGAQTAATAYSNMYLAEVHFVDGQQLTPSDFGEYDNNNLWQPKEYSGTYGTNGFYLDFSDNSSASALGTDAAGSNDWTVNNIFAGTSGLTGYYYAAGYVVSTANDAGNFNTSSSTFATFASNDSWGIYKINGSTSVNVVFKGFDTNRGFGYAFSNDSSIRNPSSVTWVSYDHGSAPGSTPVTATLSNSNGYKYLYVCGWLSGIFVPPGFNTGGDSVNFASCNDFGTTPTGQDSILDLEAGTDSLIDTPTNYEASSGNNGGNYATLNPLDDQDGPTYANGNLQVNGAGGNAHYVGRASIGVSSGKWYWEATINSSITSTYYPSPGILSMDENVPNQLGDGTSGHAYMANGQKYTNATLSSYGASFTQNDIIGFALDMGAGTLVAYKNGTSQGTMVTGLTGSWAPSWNHYQSTSLIYNFGQRPFVYTPPTGHLSLCTTNLPDPTIADGSTAMDVKLRNGSPSSTISGYGFSPDLLWEKARNQSGSHYLMDSVRGSTNTLSSDTTSAESSQPNYITGFTSDGFTTGTNDFTSGVSLVDWAWDAGSSTVSNTDGSITSNVRANASAGFSIVSYTGNGTAGATIGHGLNAVPGLLIVKNRSTSVTSPAWGVKHSGLYSNSGYWLELETSDAAVVESPGSGSLFNATNPGSSVFTVGPRNTTNTSGDHYIAYCWAPVEGYSAFGSYTGNGSTDGPFVFTGFRPKFLLYKRTDAADTVGWILTDSERNSYNVIDDYLSPTTAAAEGTTFIVDFLSNGFKMRIAGADGNVSGGNYVYAAYAEHPFASNARAR